MMHVNNCAFPDLASVAEKYAAYLGATAPKSSPVSGLHDAAEQRANATVLAEQVQLTLSTVWFRFSGGNTGSEHGYIVVEIMTINLKLPAANSAPCGNCRN